jgi:hypothetical protein
METLEQRKDKNIKLTLKHWMDEREYHSENN